VDAAYKSSETKKWEPIDLKEWRGQTGLSKPSVYKEYDENNWLIKEETLPNGDRVVIVKDKQSGEIKEVPTA
jgi:hypothetical protein